MIIGVLGEKLAGKDSVAEHLVDEYGAVHIRTSKILDDLLNVLGLPITRRNEIDVGRGMEAVFGPKIIGEAVKRRVENTDAEIIVINGLRLEDQFEDARELGATIIYVTAPAELRYERFLQRREKKEDSRQTFEQFLAQDGEWTEIGIPSLGLRADFKIDNLGTMDELFAKVDAIVEKLK